MYFRSLEKPLTTQIVPYLRKIIYTDQVYTVSAAELTKLNYSERSKTLSEDKRHPEMQVPTLSVDFKKQVNDYH